MAQKKTVYDSCLKFLLEDERKKVDERGEGSWQRQAEESVEMVSPLDSCCDFFEVVWNIACDLLTIHDRE